MGNFVFNIAMGKLRYYSELPAANDALIVLLLKSAGLQADDTLRDYDDLATLLAAANDEADFTNYARKSITSVTITPDDVNNRVDYDVANQTWAVAGGATNNALGKLLVCYDPDTTAGTDSTIIPLCAYDFVATTDASDLEAAPDAAGFARSS